jgi:hypothetical protein
MFSKYSRTRVSYLGITSKMAKGRRRAGSFEDSGGSEKRGRKELMEDKAAATSRDRRGRRGEDRLERTCERRRRGSKRELRQMQVQRTVYLVNRRCETTRTNPRRGSDGATGETKPSLRVERGEETGDQIKYTEGEPIKESVS